MIRELRLRHKRMVTVLGIFAAVVFVAALSARKPIPTMEENPLPLTQAPLPDANAKVINLTFPNLGEGFTAKVYQGRTRVLEVDVGAALKVADPLVYESPAGMKEARLLGPLPSHGKMTYSLDAAHGHILIYSLPQQEVIDRAMFDGSVTP